MSKVSVESIKIASQGLYGPLAAEINTAEAYLSEAAKQLIKFHGLYQQHDREVRKHELQAEHYSFMLRTKLPGGELTAAQYLLLDDLADQYANGTLRLTTRQTIQFHGMVKWDVRPTIRALNQALITTLGACGDVVRNVMACPAPTSDPRRQQVQAFATELSLALAPATQAYHQIWLNGEEMVNENPHPVPEPLYGESYLPRKFKIGIAFEGDNCVDVFTQDVGLVALFDENTLLGFNLLVGGGMGLTHGKEETFARLADLVGFITPDQVLETVRAIVTVHRDFGNRENRKRARLKYVLHEWGVPRFQEELQARLSFPLAPARPQPAFTLEDHLGWHEQGDGRWYLGLYVESGRIADQPDHLLRSALRTLLQQYGFGVRLTAQQSLLLTNIPAELRDEVDHILLSHGVDPLGELSGVRRYSLACPALPTCGLAIAEAERTMPHLLGELEGVLEELGLRDESLTLRVTGCPNGCARPYVAEVALVGRSLNKYTLFLGGHPAGTRLAERFIDILPYEQVIPTLHTLLAHFQTHRHPAEPFGDFVHRVGLDGLRELVSGNW